MLQPLAPNKCGTTEGRVLGTAKSSWANHGKGCELVAVLDTQGAAKASPPVVDSPVSAEDLSARTLVALVLAHKVLMPAP
jgi:hypothetical protein